MSTNFRWEQVQYALAVFRYERIHKNQSLNFRRLSLHYSANNHPGITVTHKGNFFKPRQDIRNVLDMLVQGSLSRKARLVSAETAEDRRYGSMPLLFQQRDQAVPRSCRLPCTVHKDECGHATESNRCNSHLL